MHLQRNIEGISGSHQMTVRIGNLFDDIDDVSVEMDANLVIMGTHGLKGMQFITGGRAFEDCPRMLGAPSSSPRLVPFAKRVTTTLWCLLICTKTPSKQKLAIVAEMATYFKGRVHIISPAESG